MPPVDDRPAAADDRPAAPLPRPRGRTLLVTALLAALLGGGVGGGLVAVSEHDGRTVDTGLRITNDTGAPAAKLDGTIAAAAAKIRPSVVTIEVQRRAGVRHRFRAWSSGRTATSSPTTTWSRSAAAAASCR